MTILFLFFFKAVSLEFVCASDSSSRKSHGRKRRRRGEKRERRGSLFEKEGRASNSNSSSRNSHKEVFSSPIKQAFGRRDRERKSER